MKSSSVSQLKRLLDSYFSKYIRLRDAQLTTGTDIYALCVTCDKQQEWKYMDAGHWMGRGCGSTRYDEKNVHAQCKDCNGFNGGRPDDYKRKLIELYGEEAVNDLYIRSKQTKSFTRYELINLIGYYKAQYKELNARRDYR